MVPDESYFLRLFQMTAASCSSSGWHRLYLQAVSIVRGLWQRARLVHGDLSEYNLLNYFGQVHVIDVGQAVDTLHPQAHELLDRDLATVRRFFERRKVAVHPLSVLQAFVTDPDSMDSAEEYGGGGDSGHPGTGDAEDPVDSGSEDVEPKALRRASGRPKRGAWRSCGRRMLHRGGKGDEEVISDALDRISI